MLDHQTLNELRNLILQKAGIVFISPSDCQHIALEITKHVNKTISKTTIKRLFGFAATKHNFSKFTINALLEYVDCPENEIISRSIPYPNYKSDSEGWQQIILKSKTISQHTLAKTISLCSIPYKLTITRKFAIQDFEAFYKSDFTFTAFVAPPGYGKSILLSHLVSELFLKAQAKYHNDIMLYLNAKDVLNTEEVNQDFEAELKKKLGISSYKNLIGIANHFHERTGNKLIIMIDSFQELLSNSKNKNKTFEHIIAWLCDLEESKAIKLVLGMRSYFWSRFYTLIRNSHYLKSKWHKGLYYTEGKMANVPKLSTDEVNTLLHHIDHKTYKLIIPQVKALIRYPFYIKLYYKLRNEYPKSEFQSEVIIYEIYLRYVLENIYRSNQYIEKLILCKKIIQSSNYGHKGLSMDKKLFFYDFTTFKVAYMELISDGILKENKQLDNGLLSETVSFTQLHIFEYFLFKELLDYNQNIMDKNFYTLITANYGERIRLELLKWSIFTTIRNSKYDFLIVILESDFDDQYHDEFLLFITDNIKHQLKHKPIDFTLIKDLMPRSILFTNMISKLIHTYD